MQYNRLRIHAAAVLTLVAAGVLPAQTPAPTTTAPRDTPSIKLGATIFADATFSSNPTTLDTDSNRVHLSQFNVSRAYINVTGNISHLIGFRVTPDITRESGTGSSLNGSLTLRVKYAFGQLNLDDWISKGSWLRLGIQQTPWIDFLEGSYRYRFQGPVFSEREGYLTSADAGISAHYNLPSNYGDIHAGIYNGEGYSKSEVNDQKAFQIRATLRPFAAADVLKGLRASVFYDGDHYVASAPRRRFIGALTFEHANVNAGFEYLKTRDRTSVLKPFVDGNGFSVWATPRTTMGLEGLLRYDHMTPNDTLSAQKRSRWIAGVAYWFPHVGNITSAVMLDYETTRLKNATPSVPDQNRIALHALFSF